MSHDEISDLKDWMVRIEGKIDATRTEVAAIAANGCAHRATHEANSSKQEDRLRKVETDIAESRGRDRTLNGLVSAAISVVCVFVGRMFK